MHFQYEVSPPTPTSPPLPPPSAGELAVDTLRQMLDVQREQLHLLRLQHAAHDGSARWKSFLGRWEDDFPDMGQTCRQVLPALERGYLRLIEELSRQLQSNDESGGIDDEFSLNEFLDRYGMRLAQLGTILNLVGTLAEAGKAEG